MLIYVLAFAAGVVCCAVFLHATSGLMKMQETDELTEDIIYRFQVNGQTRYEPELPAPHERDSGGYTVYYGYRVNA